MRINIIATCFGVLSLLTACTFTGEVVPDLECTKTCDEDKEECVTSCDEACVDASEDIDGGDPDVACDTDCETNCDDTYDECTVTCTAAD